MNFIKNIINRLADLFSSNKYLIAIATFCTIATAAISFILYFRNKVFSKSSRNIEDKQTSIADYSKSDEDRAIVNSDNLPVELTNTKVPNTSLESVLFREKELSLLEEHLKVKNTKALMICGFGGVGKTSLARLLYSQIKDKYDSYGWIEYHKDLKNSFAECMDLPMRGAYDLGENDIIDSKWLSIASLLKNSRRKKLLIIDNVDVDSEIGQDPSADENLTEISSWINMDIVITSRLPELKGYNSFPLNNLGDMDNKKNCIDLFYFYNKKTEKNRNENEHVVAQIVELAGFNTMIIELLAKSCAYEKSVQDYYNKLKEVGFSYPTVPVTTMWEDNSEIAIKHILKLFNIKARNPIERLIIISFSLLSEGEKVSRDELENWLGFKTESIDSLVKEGWISSDNGIFSIHPLIRQAISYTNNKEALIMYRKDLQSYRNDTKQVSIESMLEEGKLFEANEPPINKLRKLIFADSLSFPYTHLGMVPLIYMGDAARELGRRDLALKYYEMAYKKVDVSKYSQQKKIEESVSDIELEWKATYYYGYLLSYTQNGLTDAEQLLRESIKIAQCLTNEYKIDTAKMLLAESNDHLGYILFNNYEINISRIFEAKDLLQRAISQRKLLCKKNPNDLRYKHDLAWSQDNLGCLLMKADDLIKSAEGKELDNEGMHNIKALEEEIEKAEDLLNVALKTRIELFEKKKSIGILSEVAWTYCNLGACLYKNKEKVKEAEDYFDKSFRTYKEMQKIVPNFEMSSLARTYTAYAKAIGTIESRKNECIKQYTNALQINRLLEKKNPGVYTAEINAIKQELENMGIPEN